MADKSEKPDKPAKRDFDHFWLAQVYPNATESFLHSQRPINDIKDTCLVILDTNVLLMPYRLGAQSLDELKKVYSSIAEANRLAIPAQAAREFIKNRANKIRDVTREINNQVSLIQIPIDKGIGFLENEQNYKDLRDISNKIKELKSEILSKAKAINLTLKSDVGSDPVSVAYQEIFKSSVVELPLNEEEEQELIYELRWRYAHNIPPGYQDEDKLDEGIGDLLIWKTILKAAAERDADCIFVTEDAKNDWWVKSEGTFQPRIELIEEYRRATGGKTIHLVPLSEFLLIFGAEPEAVDDAKRVEETPSADKRKKLPSSQPSTHDTLLETPEDDWEQLSSRELIDLNANLSALKRQRSVEHSQIRRRLADPNIVLELSESDISLLYKEQERLWADFVKLNGQQKKIERRLKNIYL